MCGRGNPTIVQLSKAKLGFLRFRCFLNQLSLAYPNFLAIFRRNALTEQRKGWTHIFDLISSYFYYGTIWFIQLYAHLIGLCR